MKNLGYTILENSLSLDANHKVTGCDLNTVVKNAMKITVENESTDEEYKLICKGFYIHTDGRLVIQSIYPVYSNNEE